MDLSLLTREIPEGNTGLDVFDPRFDDITTAVANAQFESAASQVEEILSEGIYDWRTIGFFVYGQFLESGLAGLGDALEALTTLLRDSYELVGPEKKREKHAQATLKWLLNQLLKKMQYEEKKEADMWKGWLRATTSDQAAASVEQLDKLRRAASANLEDQAGPVLELIPKVCSWLEQFQNLVYVPPAEPEPEIVNDEPEPLTAAPEPQPGPVAMSAISAAPAAAAQGQLEGSPKLQELTRKLEAFCTLAESRQFERAAIVAEDLQELIGTFRPQDYFPQMFAPYFATMAQHVASLAPFWEDKGTPSWEAMQEFYNVDLDLFAQAGE